MAETRSASQQPHPFDATLSMALLATAGNSLVFVNLVFAAAALAIGFTAGAWVYGGRTPAETPSEPNPAGKKSEYEQQLVVEQTMMASDRLRDLASSVAGDVGAHSAVIGEIEARLLGGGSNGQPNAERVLQALNEITSVNESLASKLAKAEHQIQAQAEQIRAHESEARTDSLTNLANRRAFDQELTRRLAEWDRKGTPVSLLILDVDHFKKFNDTHGHQAGDEVLRRVGETITRCARDMDLPCRYGGEEFAVVMPTTEATAGSALVERIRSTIEAMEVAFEEKTLKVTVSLGLAGVQAGDDARSLVKRADEALYHSKDAGRNNAHRHTGEGCVPITPGKTDRATAEAIEPSPAPTVILDKLPNRTRFLEILRNEVRVAQDTTTPLTLLTADFQSYQQLVAEFGEAVARLTLDSIAQFLDNSIQEGDCLGWLNDGRFVLLLSNQTEDEASQIGDRINAALANCSVPLGGRQLHLVTNMTCSPMTDADTAVTLMRKAEEPAQAQPAATA